MTARDTFIASVKSATAAAVSTKLNNAITTQGSIEAATTAGGNPTGRGLTNATIATVKAAVSSYIATKQAAEMAQQVAIDVAKDALRNTGDNAPA